MTMSAVYEIRVAGEVPPHVIEDFALIVMAVDPVGTTMRAHVVDESGLHGILDALRRAGVELLDVRREPAFRGPDPSGEDG
jgi:hypothetical protein